MAKMDQKTMLRIEEDLQVIRDVLNSVGAIDHRPAGYKSVIMVLAFVSAATQAARQAAEYLD